MVLTYKLEHSKTGVEDPSSVAVSFVPPLFGYEEVKPRLMQMKSEAEEALGMVSYSSFLLQEDAFHELILLFQIKTPALKTYTFPSAAFPTFLTYLALALLTVAPYTAHKTLFTAGTVPPFLREYGPTINDLFLQISWLRRTVYFTPLFAQVMWTIVGMLHVLEATFVAYKCRRHSTGFGLGVSPRSSVPTSSPTLTLCTSQLLWTITVLICGYPSLMTFRGLLQNARIQSISKHQ